MGIVFLMKLSTKIFFENNFFLDGQGNVIVTPNTNVKVKLVENDDKKLDEEPRKLYFWVF